MPNNSDIILIHDNSAQAIEGKDAAIERALEAIGLHIEGEAKEELENDPRRIDTGRLRGSITYATHTEHGSGESPATALDYMTRETPEKDAVYIGSNVEYAVPVHEGTRRMAANPFLRNAVLRNKEQIQSYFERALKGEI